MQPQRKLTILLIFIFVAISIFLIAGKNLLAKWGIDNNLLLSGNGLLFIISMAVFFIQRKALDHSNPNVFLRSVMAGMMIKMFTCAIAVVVYFLISEKDFNSTTVLIFMGLYIIYLVAEVGAIMKLNKKPNA
jgi:hypothetical protein